jgi:hypothetical protein
MRVSHSGFAPGRQLPLYGAATLRLFNWTGRFNGITIGTCLGIGYHLVNPNRGATNRQTIRYAGYDEEKSH